MLTHARGGHDTYGYAPNRDGNLWAWNQQGRIQMLRSSWPGGATGGSGRTHQAQRHEQIIPPRRAHDEKTRI